MTDSSIHNKGKKVAAGAAALSVLASGGYVLAGHNNEANAAGTEWKSVEAGPNRSGTANHSSGYSINGILPDDITNVVGWENPNNDSVWGWCVEAGYRASGVSNKTGTIPVDNSDSRLAAFAMSMYGGKSTDAVTNAAVSLIVHQNLDQGAVGLDDRYETGDRQTDTRNAFKDAEGDAPQAVKDKANEIRRAFQNYKAPSETQAKVTLTPTAKRNVYTAHVDIPDNISTTVELTGGAVFADGSGTKKDVKADGNYEVVFLAANPYMSSTFSAKATPNQTSVKTPATRINTYQTDGETEGGFHYQTMAWAAPSSVNITGSTATAANTPADVKNINVGTTAVDKADGDKYISPNGGTLTDTIAYNGVAADYEHEFKAELINKETGKPVLDKDGKPIVATKKFTPSDSKGTTSIDLPVPGISAGNTFVVYETLSFNGEAIADHKDINDLGQTVYTPEAKTKAVDKADNDNYLLQSGGTIVDTVSYKGLKTGTEYEVKGVLMDKETGKEFLDDNGKPLVGTAKFTPTTENGSVKVEFEVPPAAAGKTLVAFEEVSDAEVGIVAEHKDINDEEQTVFVPDIGTTATDKADNDKSIADRNGTVVDEVAYTNLTPGKKYTFEGKLLDKVASKDGENVFLKDDKGEDIIVKKDFTPTERNGKVNLEFELPDSAAGKTLVAFEKVSDEVGVVAVHEDKDDEKQTVYVREIGTLALDKQDKDHYLAQKGGTIVDTIRYKNFVPGAEYTMKGVLVDRAATVEALKKDPEAEPVYILNERGDNVEAETTFTVPEDAKMDTEYTVPVEFKVPDSAIGKDVVVYEDAFDAEGNPVAEHKNPEDDDQTVYVADIATLAYDKADNNSHITPGGTLVDRVEYTNLVPGKEYRLEGTIFHKNEGKLTNIKASGKFTADKSGDGVANLEFKIPEDQVGGRYVVFEELYDGNNVLTAEHKNPNDANQSFEVVPEDEVPETPSENRTPPPATPATPQTPPAAPQQKVSQQSVPAPQQNAPAKVKTGGEGVTEGMNPGLAGLLAAAALSLSGAVVLRKKFSL